MEEDHKNSLEERHLRALVEGTGSRQLQDLAYEIPADEEAKGRIRDTVRALQRMRVSTAAQLRRVRSTVPQQDDPTEVDEETPLVDPRSLSLLRYAAAYEWSAQDELSLLRLRPEERVALRTGATVGVSQAALDAVGAKEREAVALLLEEPPAEDSERPASKNTAADRMCPTPVTGAGSVVGKMVSGLLAGSVFDPEVSSTKGARAGIGTLGNLDMVAPDQEARMSDWDRRNTPSRLLNQSQPPGAKKPRQRSPPPGFEQ